MTKPQTEKQDLRLEMQIKNNILWNAIFSVYSSVSEFCKKNKLHQGEVGKLLRFKCSPFKKNGEYCSTCVKISVATGIGLEDLFPKKLYADVINIGSFKAIEVCSFAALPMAAKKEISLLPAPVDYDPKITLETTEMSDKKKEAVKKVLKTLSYREREIIKLRYGLGKDGKVYSLTEIGHIFKVTWERIRQIEAKAIRKLQQPSRSQELVEFLT